jgi:hypothetical protein
MLLCLSRRFWFCLALAFTFSASAWAVPDFHKTRVFKELHHKECEMNEAVFGGEAFQAGVSLDAARSFKDRFVRHLNNAVSLWNKVPPNDRSGADAGAIVKELNDKRAWAKAMEAAIPLMEELKASSSESESTGPSQVELKKAFLAEYSEQRGLMATLLTGRQTNVGTVAAMKAELAMVKEGCLGKYKILSELSYDVDNVRTHLREPAAWCALAIEGGDAAIASSYICKEAKYVQKEIDKEQLRAVTMETVWGDMYGAESFIDGTRSRDAKSQACVKDSLYESYRTTYKQVWENTKASAVSEHITLKMRNAHAESLAKKRTTDVGLTVLKAGFHEPKWTVKLNVASVPIERLNHVQVLAKRPGESLCRILTGVYKEKYVNGAYVRGQKVIRFHQMKWASCQ